MQAKICDVCGKVFGDDGKEPHIMIIRTSASFCDGENRYAKELCTECIQKVIDIIDQVKSNNIL